MNFCLNLNTYRNINNWDDGQSAQYFHLFLAEGPANWYRTLDDEVKQDYNSLKELFLTTFDSERSSFYNKLSMFSRDQKINETVDSYLSDLYKLFSGNSKCTEETKAIIFIKGLRPNLMDFVISNKPETLLEAVQSAKLKENLLSWNVAGARTIDPTTLNILSQIKQSSDKNDMKNMISSTMNETLSNFMDQISKIMQRIENNSQNSMQSVQSHPEQNDGYSKNDQNFINNIHTYKNEYKPLDISQTRLFCSYCKKNNHVIQNCFRLRNKNSSGQNLSNNNQKQNDSYSQNQIFQGHVSSKRNPQGQNYQTNNENQDASIENFQKQNPYKENFETQHSDEQNVSAEFQTFSTRRYPFSNFK